jgi:hypothetical protein
VELSQLSRNALGVYAAAMLVACGEAPAQFGAPSVAGQVRQAAALGAARSWMMPDAYRGDLIYAGGDASSYVLAYPSGKLVGQIAMRSLGTCADSEGNVYFTGAGAITEFAHGRTKPMTTYAVQGNVYACSVDPASGDIAAVVFCASGCGDSVAVIRPHSGAAPTLYSDPDLPSLLFCTYDNLGNIFVDGFKGSQFGIAELPHNATAFINFTVSRNIPTAEQIQWDGQYLAVETRISPEIDQIRVEGSNAKIVNTVKLKGAGHRATQSWIQNAKIAVPTAVGHRALDVFVWSYPTGGEPIKRIKGFIGGGHQQVDSVAFSLRREGLSLHRGALHRRVAER